MNMRVPPTSRSASKPVQGGCPRCRLERGRYGFVGVGPSRREQQSLRDTWPASLRRGLTRAATLLAVLVAPALLSAFAQPFALESWSIDGGGGTSAGGGFSVSGTIGQPDAGTLSGGGFGLVGGFPGFHVVPAGPMTVALQILADGRVHVTWPGAEAAWQLEAASRLGSSPDWQTVTAPGATSYTAPATGPARFFRLRRQ